MEKSFKNYYIEGLKNSYKTLYRRKRNLFKFYICFFIYILSIPLFILKPVINLGIFRLGNQINDDNDIDLTSLTKSCDNPKNYFTTLFAGLIKILIILGIIIFWLVIAGVLAGIGLIILRFSGKNDYSIVLLFATPAQLVLLIYLIMIPIMYVEIGYIVNSNNDINASNALNISFNAYKKEGKKERFLIILVNCLILVGYLAIFGVIAALPIIINGYDQINLGITLLIVVLAFIPYSMLAPLFALGTISSITLLNDDVVKDTLTDVVSVTNVKFHLPKKDLEELTTEEKLTYIFDKADDLKPTIKDLRILDSLDIVDGDGNVTNNDAIEEKPVAIEKEPIKEDITEESKVLENNFIEETVKQEDTEVSWSDEPVEEKDEVIENTNKEVIEEIENENKVEDEKQDDIVSDPIMEEPDQLEEEKIEVVSEIENNNELVDEEDFNLTDDESIDIKDIDGKEESIDEVEKAEEMVLEETAEEVSEDSPVALEETPKETPVFEEIKVEEPIEPEENKEENSIDEPIEVIEEKEIEPVEENEEIVEENNSNIEEEPKNGKEDFDLDLFDENELKEEEDIDLEEFLKKGDE